MNMLFSQEERLLLELLKAALQNKYHTNVNVDGNVKISEVISLAKRHAVISLLYDLTNDNPLFEKYFQQIEVESRRIVMQSYRLLFLTRYVINLLNNHDIKVAVLKGVATASMYGVPELRKSGDVDLLIPDNVNKSKLESIMKHAGFTVSAHNHANHHYVFVSPEGINIEIHTMLSEPFVYKHINKASNKYLKEAGKHIQSEVIMGTALPILDKPFHAYELLLHMLQHLMYSGFGLKLLCDWVCIWNSDWTDEQKVLFVEMVKESGLKRFSDMLTSICVKYLGLDASNYPCDITDIDDEEELLQEILKAEDLGNSDDSRMLIMSGTGVKDYVRELHHQMHLNFPKAGKCFLLWPVLWVITLVKFLYNNRKVRNISTKQILKEAKRRSKLMEKIKILQ